VHYPQLVAMEELKLSTLGCHLNGYGLFVRYLIHYSITCGCAALVDQVRLSVGARPSCSTARGLLAMACTHAFGRLF